MIVTPSLQAYGLSSDWNIGKPKAISNEKWNRGFKPYDCNSQGSTIMIQF